MSSLKTQLPKQASLTETALAFAFNMLALFFLWLMTNSFLSHINYEEISFQLFWLGACVVAIYRAYLLPSTAFKEYKKHQDAHKDIAFVAIARAVSVGLGTLVFYFLKWVLF